VFFYGAAYQSHRAPMRTTDDLGMPVFRDISRTVL